MDTGPFFSGTIQTPGVYTPKGLVVRVGDKGDGAVCYDTELLRVSAAWTGDFLNFNPARYGIIVPPKPAGEFQFASPVMPGFAKDGSFADPRLHKPWGPLPRDWAHYKGLYLHNNRIVLKYNVGETNVLESPWLETHSKTKVLTRTLEISPHDQEIKMLVADSSAIVALKFRDGSVSISVASGGRQSAGKSGDNKNGRTNARRSPAEDVGCTRTESAVLVTIPPSNKPVRIKLFAWPANNPNQKTILQLVKASAPPQNLSALTKSDSPRWTADITTKGVVSADKNSPYVIDTLTLPFKNPYKALMFTSGHDFFSNGDAAVCTLHGDVWIVSGIDTTLKQLKWKRFATGLFQPLGLKIVDNQIYVVGRDQITRLHDRNNDGEADYYENFNNDGHTSFGGHEYVTCLETDSHGNFYYVKGNGPASSAHQGCLLRVSNDGSKLDVVATGFRNPNGISIGPRDEMTVAPQEGEWTPGSAIFWVKPGGFYGFVPSAHRAKPPTMFDPPLCWLPRLHDNSCGGQVWVDSDRWGPLKDQLLHFSFGQSSMMLVLREEIDGQQQGGTIDFPLSFDSGVMRGRFRQYDGQLYVTGLKGWVSNAVNDGCFQRVRYMGTRVDMPVSMRTHQNGVSLTFTEPLDRNSAEDPDNFNVEQWNYRWAQTYGSPEYKVSEPKVEGRDPVDVESATLLDDRTVFLEVKNLKPVMQMGIGYTFKSRAGAPLRQQVYLTLNKIGRESVAPKRLRRHVRPGKLSDEIQARLKPGVLARLQSADQSRLLDAWSQRMLAFIQTSGSVPSPLVSRSASVSLRYAGFLNVPLKGQYRFSFKGHGQVQFMVNGKHVLRPKDFEFGKANEFVAELHKGFNSFQLTYNGHHNQYEFRAYWQGDDFPREPIPPTVLFHDSGDADLNSFQLFHKGRELFTNRKCFACHVDAKSRSRAAHQPAMPKIYESAPSLNDVGKRLNADWLVQWLLNPRGMRNHTAMPQLLGDRPTQTARNAAADLTAYLMSSQPAVGTPTTLPPPIQPIERRPTQRSGEQLYEQLGCIACHRFTPPNEDDEYNRTSLHFVNSKFQPHKLKQFLAKPEASHASTRMPNFRLNPSELERVAEYVRENSQGRIDQSQTTGDAARGKQLYESLRCAACHSNASEVKLVPVETTTRGCLADANQIRSPRFGLNSNDRSAIRHFLKIDPTYRTLFRKDAQSAERLIRRLNCVACHDRDQQRSHRRIILADEGSDGRVGPPLPNLTWAGDKLHRNWMFRLFNGNLKRPMRSWLKARMPAYPAHATLLSEGIAAQHGWFPHPSVKSPNPESSVVEIGRRLTQKNGGLDCRQCHAIGKLQPTGDKNTQIALGINFAHIRDRLRYDYYRRFMLDPPRYDVGLKMPKLSADGKTTKIRDVLGGDAAKQFDALWHYIQTVKTK